MQAKVINPYPFIGTKHKETLDFIIANLPANPTFENLNEALVNGIFTPDPENPSIGDLAVILLGTVLPNAYNGYMNGWTTDDRPRTTDNRSDSSVVSGNTKYSETQLRIINQMLEGINHVPVESIAAFLRSVEESIVSSGLNYEEQVPLFIATVSGISEHEYWMAQVTTPGTWAIYLPAGQAGLNADSAINYLHVAGWVSAAMQGALLTYGLVKPPQLQPLDIFSSLVGSIGLAAGKVVFGWVPNG